MESQWFIGVAITRSQSPTPSYVPLFEESFVLVNAPTKADASSRIEAIVRNGLAAFKNDQGEEVEWVLERILEIKELAGPPGDGVEVYSRFFRDFGAYKKFEPLLEGSVD